MKQKLLSLFAGLILLVPAYAQDRVISGRVVTTDGDTAPGVSIVVKGTTLGTASDNDGRYSLNVPQGSNTLIFSFIGYKTVEVEIGSRTTVDVTMEVDITQLSEVVVVGYGTQLKQDVTGNIAKVGGEAIQNVPVTTFEQALQGRAAGVLVTAQNGKLGGGINIRIRGSSSITASNEPLYVIDGVPVTSQSQSGTAAATNPLADLNFNDIESMEILKDASASAIYGSRASNGVVLITTKRGKSGKTNFNIGYQYGVSRPSNHVEFLNSAEYIELFREAAYNRDVAAGYDPINNPADYPDSWLEYMDGTMDYLAGHTDWRNLENDTNWEKEAYQDARISNFDFSASGGTDKTRFYFSGSHSDQDGILIGNFFQRTSGRLNLDHEISKKLSFGLNVGISRTINERVTADNAFSTPMQLVAQSPLTPVRDEEGNYYDNTVNPAMIYYPATMQLGNAFWNATVYRNLFNAFAKYNISNSLSLRGEYGFDLLTQNEDSHYNSKTESASTRGEGYSRWVQIFNYTTRLSLNWNKTLNEHTINADAGIEYQESNRNETSVTGQNFPIDDFTRIGSAVNITAGTSTLNEFTFLSYIGRVNYKFRNRYLLTLSGRIDGSSRFGENQKFGFFPAASAGWVISEESFLAGNETLSFFKLKGSYGLTGNAEIGNYEHLALFDGAAYGGEPGLTPQQIGNPDLSWEKTTQMDIGIEFGLIKDKLTGEIDYYNKNTTDLLLNIPVPSTTGFTTTTRNVGELENKGFEFALNYSAIRTDALSVDVGLNFATNENKVLRLADGQERIDPGSSRYLNAVVIGEPLGVFYGPQYAGVDPANGNALFYVNGDTPGETTSSYNQAQRVALGSPLPTRVFGFNGSVKFKGFEFDFLFQGVGGNKVYNAAGGFMSANALYEDNQTRDQLRRWQQPGDITDVPQARLYRTNGTQASSRYLYDASYIRLKTLTLAYNFPQSMISKLQLTNLRLYVTGQNLLTFTDYPNWDPEVNTDYFVTNINQGNDFYSAPQPKNIVFGVKLGF